MRSYTDEILTPPPMVTTPVPLGADFGIRLGARVIDTLFGNLIMAGLAGLVGGIALAVLHQMGRAPDNWVELLQASNYWSYVYSILGGIFFHTLAEGMGGTTIGKLCCGLRVVQQDGGPCRFVPAFKRSLAYLMDALFFGLIAWESMKKSGLRQRHGDVWAKTVVVKKSIFTPTPQPAVWKMVLGILLGAAVWFAAHLGSMFSSVFGP